MERYRIRGELYALCAWEIRRTFIVRVFRETMGCRMSKTTRITYDDVRDISRQGQGRDKAPKTHPPGPTAELIRSVLSHSATIAQLTHQLQQSRSPIPGLRHFASPLRKHSTSYCWCPFLAGKRREMPMEGIHKSRLSTGCINDPEEARKRYVEYA